MSQTIRDLGRFDTPVLLCGGAYGNLEALDALLAEAGRRGIPPANIIHSGDAIAYCSDPEAVARRLSDRGIASIKGNVEDQLAANAGDCACGFEEGSACQVMAVEWYAYADSEISGETRDWCAALPDQLAFTMKSRRFRVVHGSVTTINRFMFGSLDEDEFELELRAAESDVVVAGHTGLPFTRHIDARVWHNTGALGLPANDGTTRVWFSVVTPLSHGVRFEHFPLDYDHAAAADKMRRRGLSEAYAHALESGVWPSLDILPAAERAATGKALHPGMTVWAAVPRNAA